MQILHTYKLSTPHSSESYNSTGRINENYTLLISSSWVLFGNTYFTLAFLIYYRIDVALYYGCHLIQNEDKSFFSKLKKWER